MTTSIVSLSPNNNTDAAFRAWGKGVSDAIQALGLVKTADTGQISWTTVLAPTVSDTVQGFEIFRFDDALQATTPVFIKIEYGSGTSSAQRPGIWVTVGTGTNGAGALTGQVSTRKQVAASGVSTASFNCYFSAATNRLAMGLWAQAGVVTYSILVSVERSHNSSGADTADGFMVFTGGSAAGYISSQYVHASGTIVPQFSTWNAVLAPSGGQTYGANTYVSPVRAWMPGDAYPSHNLYAYVNTDITNGSTITITGWDGTARNYLCFGSPNITAVGYGSSAGYPAMRWD